MGGWGNAALVQFSPPPTLLMGWRAQIYWSTALSFFIHPATHCLVLLSRSSQICMDLCLYRCLIMLERSPVHILGCVWTMFSLLRHTLLWLCWPSFWPYFILDCINMMLQPVTVRCRCDSVVQRRTSTWVNTNLKWVNLVSLIEVVSCLVSPDHLFTYMFHLRLWSHLCSQSDWSGLFSLQGNHTNYPGANSLS